MGENYSKTNRNPISVMGSVLEDTRAKFENYRFRIDRTSSEPYDTENEAVDVRIKARNGEEYSANFTTPRFLNYMFEKNKRTGECLSGTYFCMPGMIIVEKLTEDNLKRTIDDLINNFEIEEYFKKVD